MDFSEALIEIKRGRRLRRAGWNGQSMFVYMVRGSRFKATRPPLDGFYTEGTTIEYRPHIDMRTADGEHVPWVASQTDLLAEDWELVD